MNYIENEDKEKSVEGNVINIFHKGKDIEEKKNRRFVLSGD